MLACATWAGDKYPDFDEFVNPQGGASSAATPEEIFADAEAKGIRTPPRSQW